MSLLSHLKSALTAVFLSGSMALTLTSLFCAMVIAAGWLLMRRARRNHRRPLRLKTLVRALFPHSIWTHASTRTDIGFYLLNTFVTGTLIGWSLMSASGIFHFTSDLMQTLFGPAPAERLPGEFGGAILTIVLFVAYDFAYWLDHYIKHKVPFLWPFHRVHHTAAVLTPLTVYRVHPVDSLILTNIAALIVGLAGGVAHYLLGGAVTEITFAGMNCILAAFMATVIHLQHSHIRITFPGIWGRIFFSPMHHHVHHSVDPAHYDSNMGSCLTIWDGMFGTLVTPDPAARLTFGTTDTEVDEHSASGTLIHPFVLSARTLIPARPLIDLPDEA